MSWPPHITVATVVERNNTFLVVEEFDNQQSVLNQPAGHLEPNETLQDAALRETLEETAWQVQLLGLIGVYQYYSSHNDTTYLRFCFKAKPILLTDSPLDPDISAVHWLSREQIASQPLRSPLVLQCLDDSKNEALLPLNLIQRH